MWGSLKYLICAKTFPLTAEQSDHFVVKCTNIFHVRTKVLSQELPHKMKRNDNLV